MKKTTLKLLLLLVTMTATIESKAQSDYFDVLYTANGTSANARAPQGSRTVARSVYLITSAEMAASGLINGDVINAIGFSYSAAQDITTNGTAVFYLQNTSDATNTKSTNWATAITGMTTVSNAALTIPNTVGDLLIPFSGGSAFTYTGGGVYVAFDYQNLSNPLSTNSTVLCNTDLVSGLLGAQSSTATIPTTLTASNYRPITKLGKSTPCSKPVNIYYNPTLSTLNSTNVSFTSPDGGSNFQLEYGPYGYTQGTGTVVTPTASPYTVSTLAQNTVYDYYMRKNCGSGVFSEWNGPFSFATLFNASNLPYNTSFEHDELAFVGWKNPNYPLVAGDWGVGNYGAGPLVQDGVASVASITPAAVAANNYMFSRGINLTAGNQVTITYYIRNYQSGTTQTGNYSLTVGNAPTVGAQTTVVGSEVGLSTITFTLKTFTYTPPSTGVYYFAFRNTTTANATGTHALVIDNFTVDVTAGTNDFVASKLSVYPNPVNNIVNVSVKDNLLVEKIAITDVNGRTVKNISVKDQVVPAINVSDLNTGVYFMNIETQEGTAVKKIVKN